MCSPIFIPMCNVSSTPKRFSPLCCTPCIVQCVLLCNSLDSSKFLQYGCCDVLCRVYCTMLQYSVVQWKTKTTKKCTFGSRADVHSIELLCSSSTFVLNCSANGAHLSFEHICVHALNWTAVQSEHGFWAHLCGTAVQSVHICVELQTVHIWVSSTFVLIPNVEVLCTFVLNCNVCTFGFRAERNRVFSKPPSFLIPASHWADAQFSENIHWISSSPLSTSGFWRCEFSQYFSPRIILRGVKTGGRHLSFSEQEREAGKKEKRKGKEFMGTGLYHNLSFTNLFKEEKKRKGKEFIETGLYHNHVDNLRVLRLTNAKCQSYLGSSSSSSPSSSSMSLSSSSASSAAPSSLSKSSSWE